MSCPEGSLLFPRALLISAIAARQRISLAIQPGACKSEDRERDVAKRYIRAPELMPRKGQWWQIHPSGYPLQRGNPIPNGGWEYNGLDHWKYFPISIARNVLATMSVLVRCEMKSGPIK